MKSYILKPKSVRKSDILQKDYILSSARHHKININKNHKLLVDLIKISKNSLNISNKKKYFNYVEIGSISNSTGYVSPSYKKSIDISTDSVFNLQKDDILISTVRTYLGGIGIITQSENNIVASKALIVLRDLIDKAVNRYYLFGVLRSRFFIEQTSLILNASMYPRMDKDSFNQLKVPFPTKNNHPEPNKIEQLVSLITQNIIDKEAQIKAKNHKIDELIERELRENQNPKNSFKYSYPTISKITKNESRLDTRTYEKDFRKLNFLLENYSNSSSTIDKLNFKIRRGQNLQVSCVGESYYSERPKKNFCHLITSTNINFSRQLLYFSYIGNKNKLSQIIENDVMVAATGVNTGKSYIFPEVIPNSVSNINSFFLNHKNKTLSILVGLFFSYVAKFDFCKKIGSQSNGGSILDKDLKQILIPNFPDQKQQEITAEYYRKIDKNQNLTLENYLQKETARNQQIGIFQLNMEIFELRAKLEEIIDKIINDEPVGLDLCY